MYTYKRDFCRESPAPLLKGVAQWKTERRQSINKIMAQSSGPSTRVMLRISCRDLKDTDVLSKSDPLVTIYVSREKKWTEVGITLALFLHGGEDPVTRD